jgi:hypothetical protein
LPCVALIPALRMIVESAGNAARSTPRVYVRRIFHGLRFIYSPAVAGTIDYADSRALPAQSAAFSAPSRPLLLVPVAARGRARSPIDAALRIGRLFSLPMALLRMPKMLTRQRVICSAMLLSLTLVFSSASAQVFPALCSRTSDCPDGQSCQVGAFGLKWCLFEFCNVNSDCSRRGSVCTLGICRLAGGGGGGGTGGGIGLSGEGCLCGPQRLGGGVVKSVGCQQGLQCTHGRCQRLPR